MSAKGTLAVDCNGNRETMDAAANERQTKK